MKYLSLTNIQHFLDKIKTFVLDKINAIPDPMHYVGTWNAAENHPELAQTDMAKAGYVYRVTVAGEQFGIAFKPGDRLVYDERGRAEKWDTTDEVWSVNGKTGDVVLPECFPVRGTLASLDELDAATEPGVYVVNLPQAHPQLDSLYFALLVLDEDGQDIYAQLAVTPTGELFTRTGSEFGSWTKVGAGGIPDLGSGPDLDEVTGSGVYRYTTVGAGKDNSYNILVVACRSGGNSLTSTIAQTRFTPSGTQARTGTTTRGTTTWTEWTDAGASATPALPAISAVKVRAVGGTERHLHVLHGPISPALMALNPTLGCAA